MWGGASSSNEVAALKEAALAKCKAEETLLINCYTEGNSFFDCAKYNSAFWRCYEKHRGVGKTKAGAWLDQLWEEYAPSPPPPPPPQEPKKG